MTAPETPGRTVVARNVVFAVLAALGLMVAAGGLAKYILGIGEYPVYATAAHHMLDGDPMYIPAGDPSATTAPFTYPPFFALPFVALLPFPWIVQKILWYAVSLGALGGVLYVVRSAVLPIITRRDGRTVIPEWGFWLLWGVLVGRYVLAGFEMQSHDILVVLLTALCLQAGSSNQELRAGLYAGLAAACKATPLLFAPVFLGQRRYRALGCLAAALVAATLLPDLITPARDRTPWVTAWYNTFLHDIRPGATAQAQGAWSRWNELNQGLAGTVYRLSARPAAAPGAALPDVHVWLPSPRVLSVATTTLQLAVLGLLGLALWPRRNDLSADELRFVRFGQGGVVLCAMLLLSPMSSKAHFAALMLPMAFCVANFLYRRRDPLVGAGFLLLIVASSLTVKGIWGSAMGNVFLAYGSVCWSTLLCMLLTVRVVRTCGVAADIPAGRQELPPPLPPRRPRFLGHSEKIRSSARAGSESE